MSDLLKGVQNTQKTAGTTDRNSISKPVSTDERLTQNGSIMTSVSSVDFNRGSFSGGMSLNDLSEAIMEEDLIEDKKQIAASAKQEYLDEPSGTSKELKLQKAYIDAENDYARAVINKKDATEDEIYDAILELRRVVTKSKSSAVADKVATSKSLLNELDKKREPFLESKRKEIMSQMEGEFDEEMAKKIAEASQKQAGTRTASMSKCAQYVRLALEDSGIVEPKEVLVSDAYMLKEKYPKTGSFEQVSVDSIQNLDALPAGCLIVWQPGPGFGKGFEVSGHVVVTQGNGKATTDYNQYIKDYGTEFTVFVPKKVSTSEREQNAIASRQAYVNASAKTGEMQRQYLYDYINWAKAAINDDNVSQDSLKDLEKRLKEVPENNKTNYVKDLVDRCNELLPKVQEKITK